MQWSVILSVYMGSCGGAENTSSVCENAVDHLADCTGLAFTLAECDGEVVAESRLILSLQCDELLDGLGTLPLCETTGFGCNINNSCAARSLDATEYHDLLEYSDSTSINSVDDVEDKLTGIADIFSNIQDNRGAFAVMYRPITENALDSIYAQEFTHDLWTRELVIEFASRYFDNLRANLLAQPMTTYWQRYYNLSEDCSASPARIAAVGVTTHLLIDLPESLAAISSEPQHQDDYEYFGLGLVEATPTVIADLDYAYGTNSGGFFQGYFIGNWVDSVWGESTTTAFAFQSIRGKAWRNGRWLQDWRSVVANIEMTSSWYAADGLLATLDMTGAL